MGAFLPGRFERRFEQVPNPNVPAETDDDPNQAEEISHVGDAAEPTDVETDIGQKSPASTSLSAVARELVRTTQVNLGHPSKVQFLQFSARQLRDLCSPTSDISSRVRFARPCPSRRVTDEQQFLHIVAVDLFFLICNGLEVPILDVVGHGTNHQQCGRLPDWRWRHGPPDTLQSDGGSEVKSEFERGCDCWGCFQHAGAPDPNRRCERYWAGYSLDSKEKCAPVVTPWWSHLRIWTRSFAGLWRTRTASFTEVDTHFFGWCSGRILDCRMSSSATKPKTRWRSPRASRTKSKARSQRRMRARTLALETDAPGFASLNGLRHTRIDSTLPDRGSWCGDDMCSLRVPAR